MEFREFTKQELDKILDNHKLWLASGGEKGERADLESANLKYANLERADLESANLKYANLESANLKYANLERADLERANLKYANLESANLKYANLKYANLERANLVNANLDFSAFPLWCGGLDVHIDDKIATQLLYHLVRNVKYSKYTSKQIRSLCKLKSIIKQANKFHRVKECGEIKED